MSTQSLAKQLAYLRRFHSIVSARDHFSEASNCNRRSRPRVVLTVDDGYADFVDNAYPVFKEYSACVTVFLATGFVNQEYWFWWDRLRYCLDKAEHLPPTLTLPIGNSPVHFASNSKNLWSDIATAFVSMPPAYIESSISQLANILSVDVPVKPPKPYQSMTWADVRQAQSNEVEFGTQTRNHPSLTALSAEQAYQEIIAGETLAKSEMIHLAPVFCYPHGTPDDYSMELERLVRDLGFNGAYAAHQKTSDSDRFSFPRYGATNDILDFKWKMIGAERLIMKLKSALRQ